MRKQVYRVIGIGVILLGIAAPLSAQTTALDRLAGTWKEDESKRKEQGRLIFQRDAKGGIEEVRGGEASPVMLPVVFDGKPRPTLTTNTYVWTQADARTFTRTLSNGESLISTRRLRTSADGKTLTEETETKTVEGSPVTTTATFQRSAGDPTGLVGRWELQSIKSSRPEEVRYERVGAALKGTNSFGVTYTVSLDGKPVILVGPAMIKGTMIAAKMVNDRTIEFTWSRNGTVVSRGTLALAADGKSYTMTSFQAGPNASKEPSTSMFVRQ